MSQGGMFIRINLQERQLYLYKGERLFGVYKVAIGKPATPSPVGKWKIANKSIIPGNTVYGTRWMGLNINTYGIHGNNNPQSIGNAVSLGCIRMYNHDVEAIFPLIPIGTPVEIVAGSSGGGGDRPPVSGKPPSGGPTGDKIYVIKKGDTLWAIATRFGIPLEELLRLNPSVDPDRIFPGDVIRLR